MTGTATGLAEATAPPTVRLLGIACVAVWLAMAGCAAPPTRPAGPMPNAQPPAAETTSSAATAVARLVPGAVPIAERSEPPQAYLPATIDTSMSISLPAAFFDFNFQLSPTLSPPRGTQRSLLASNMAKAVL